MNVEDSSAIEELRSRREHPQPDPPPLIAALDGNVPAEVVFFMNGGRLPAEVFDVLEEAEDSPQVETKAGIFLATVLGAADDFGFGCEEGDLVLPGFLVEEVVTADGGQRVERENFLEDFVSQIVNPGGIFDGVFHECIPVQVDRSWRGIR